MTLIQNGKVTKGRSQSTVYFAYNADTLAMFFSAQANDPRDLIVKKGDGKSTFTNGNRIVDATLITTDGINQWTIDKVANTVTWSVIGKAGTALAGQQASTNFQCSIIR